MKNILAAMNTLATESTKKDFLQSIAVTRLTSDLLHADFTSFLRGLTTADTKKFNIPFTEGEAKNKKYIIDGNGKNYNDIVAELLTVGEPIKNYLSIYHKISGADRDFFVYVDDKTKKANVYELTESFYIAFYNKYKKSLQPESMGNGGAMKLKCDSMNTFIKNSDILPIIDDLPNFDYDYYKYTTSNKGYYLERLFINYFDSSINPYDEKLRDNKPFWSCGDTEIAIDGQKTQIQVKSGRFSLCNYSQILKIYYMSYLYNLCK